MPHTKNPAAVAGVIVGESALRIWSLTSPQRLQRQLVRVNAASDSKSAPLRLLLRADWVYDEAIIRGMVQGARELALVTAEGECVAAVVNAATAGEAAEVLVAGSVPAGLPTVTPTQMADGYNDALRKREPSYLMPLTAGQLPAIEARVFAGAYKGVTDFVTLYVWPRPARAFTRWCAHLGVTPNMVTSLSLILVVLAMIAFYRGHYIWGLLAAWPMTFLDTVDGKLARVTLQSSPFGNIYDHSIDLIHPPLWWWAWIVGLSSTGMPLQHSGLVLWTIVLGYVAQRLEEGLFIACFKMDMHVWQRFDSALRLITARRNPNLVILTIATLLGRPDWGIETVAAWVAICLVLHGLRLAQAAIARRHGPLRSWLASPGQ
jgi:phosphatidylglycerophosphate synthase